MNHQTIEAFAEAFAGSPRLAELEIRSPDTGTLRLRRNPSPASAKPRPAPKPVAVPLPLTGDIATEPAFVATGTLIESSLVGVFRASAKIVITVGSIVSQGQSLGAVEVMRLSSDVPAPVAGEITRMFVQDGEPVEYGQPLFEIAPDATKETEDA
ncbi:MAG: biotin/lipoyl-binding protein [Armatimonadetes bacterium]|nr:biotin/lipoyl-binding protein [Armatimonadota bacterium]